MSIIDTKTPVTEGELKQRSLAPRVTLMKLEDTIVHEAFFNMGQSYDHFSIDPAKTPESLYCLTVCVLTLKNGFTVTGESACASRDNYKQDLGERIAREKAVEKIWPLMGYELRTHLMEQGHAE